MFFERTFPFFGGYYDFFIFLVKDILISFQRYNDFSDNSVLYYLLHFLTSPCTIRLEEKKISGKDNSLHSVKPSFSGICRKRASPRLPPQGGPYFCNALVMGLYPTHNAVFKSRVIFLRT
jgi:hypothetical protein